MFRVTCWCFIMWHGLERRRKNPAQTEITTPATVSIFATYTGYCCGTCNQYWETTMHILHDCQVANKVWKKRFHASGTFQYHMNNIREWFRFPFIFFICDGDRAEKGLCYGFYGMPGTLFTFKIRSPARRIIKIANSTLSAYKQALTSSSHSTQHWHLSLVQDHHRHSFLWSLELSPVIFRGLDYVEQP